MPDVETVNSGSNTAHEKSETNARKDSSSSGVTGQVCSNCGTTKTPLWRRGADGKATCNACGLYFRANNTHRPVHLKKPPHVIALSKEQLAPGTCKGDGRCNGTGGSSACTGCPAFDNRVLLSAKGSDVVKKEDEAATKEIADDSLAVACSNCSTTITPLWRRDDSGNTICNACGLYYRLHKTHRPVTYKRQTIKRRKRTPTSQQMFDMQQELQKSQTKPKQEASNPLPPPLHQKMPPSRATQGSSIQQITPVTTPESKVLDPSRVLPPLGSSTQLPPFSMIGRLHNNLHSIPAVDFTSIYSRTSHVEQSSLRTSTQVTTARSQEDHHNHNSRQQLEQCASTRPILANLMNPGKDKNNKT